MRSQTLSAAIHQHIQKPAAQVASTRRAGRLAVLAVAGLATWGSATSSWAGPRVGELIGTPSPVSVTVQAKVVSATPVVGQIAVPRQVCYDETRQDAPRSSGAGAIMGAIAGGAVGNAVGKGAGKALATGLGIFGGAIAGNHIEIDGRQGRISTVRRCEQRSSYENRVVAYNVTYEYGGQRYTTQMSHEPGQTIPLQVTLTPLVQEQNAQPASLPDDDGYLDEDPGYDDAPYPPRRPHDRRWD